LEFVSVKYDLIKNRKMTMKQLQVSSMIVLVLGMICFLLGVFVLSVPDWFKRVTGIFLMISVFALVFSSVRLYLNKGN
jgi:uncharacterized membrane protein YiaA